MTGYIQDNYKIQNNKLRTGFTKPAFNGSFTTKATDIVSKGIKGIETGGVLVDFCLVDAVSMIIPRTYQAYHRNEDDLGHPNYKAGTEELIREIFSGPSMFVIPMGFIALSEKLFGKASKIQFKTLDSLTDSFKGLLNKGNIPKDKTKLKESFYRNILNEAFENHRQIKLDTPVNINEQIEKTVKKLSEAETAKKTNVHFAEITKIVSDLNKAHGVHLDNSQNVTLKGGLTKEIGSLATDLINYSKDIVEKTGNRLSKGSKNSQITGILEKLHKTKVNGRRTIFALTVLSTCAFLYIIPIMYKRNKQFPGIDGLVDENKNTLKIAEQKKISSLEIRKNEFFNSKTNVDLLKSFNKSPDTQKNSQKNQNNVSFGSSSSAADRFFKKFDFNGHSAPYAVLGLYTLGVMLGARLYQARNADERREVATRDFSGLTTIVFAVPVFRNITSTIARKISGFPISKSIKSALGHFNPTNKPYSFENINDIYSGISKYKNGIVDFSENIHNNGGDLRKIFSFLTDDSKNALNKIAEGLSKKNSEIKPGKLFGFLTKPFRGGTGVLSLPETNEEIIGIFKKAQQHEKYKPLLQKVTNEIDKQSNHLVKFTEGLKSIPEAASIIGISAFLGWFLPWFNIHYTRKLYKDKNTQNQNLSKPVNIFEQPKQNYAETH